MKKELPHFLKNGLKTALVLWLLLELISGVFLIVLVNFKSYQNYSAQKTSLLQKVLWFEERYDFHPYLNYALKGVDESVRQPTASQTLKVAIQGGSFAMFFAEYLKKYQQTEDIKSLLKGTNFTDIVFINMAAGGYRQPQQLISSSLWAHFADLFISIEGFNEYAEVTPTCLPPEWSRQGLRFSPSLTNNFYARAAMKVKGLYQTLYHWSEGIDPLGKVTFFFSHKALLKLYYSAHGRFFKAIQNSPQCTALAEKTKKQYLGQVEGRHHDWELFLRRHHQLHNAKKNLITILQPNHHFTNSKPLSPFEKELIAQSPMDFVDKKYPLAQGLFQKLKLEGYASYDFSLVFKENKETLYRDSCCHLNDTGHELFFKAITPLIQNHLLEMKENR